MKKILFITLLMIGFQNFALDYFHKNVAVKIVSVNDTSLVGFDNLATLVIQNNSDECIGLMINPYMIDGSGLSRLEHNVQFHYERNKAFWDAGIKFSLTVLVFLFAEKSSICGLAGIFGLFKTMQAGSILFDNDLNVLNVCNADSVLYYDPSNPMWYVTLGCEIVSPGELKTIIVPFNANVNVDQCAISMRDVHQLPCFIVDQIGYKSAQVSC